MSDEAPLPADHASLEIDLARSFLPAWAQEAKGPAAPVPHREYPEEHPRGKDRDRRPRRGGRDRERRPDRKSDHKPERRPPREHQAVLEGWSAQIAADPRGIEGLARQIKADARAYSLFDLALLVLEKSERYLVEMKRSAGTAPALFQLQTDGSVWLNEREAIAHALAHHLDKFYRREQVRIEPPKGSYPFVAVCGLSGTLLGPPNYHDYQTKLRQLHAQRFAHMPFDVYKGRVRMERGEEFIEKWKEEQSTREEFLPADSPEGAAPARLGGLAEVERHFRQNHASVIQPVADHATVPGPAAVHSSSPAARLLARRTVDELRRFPLPLAHTLGQGLMAKGLQVFKAHENITYVAVARPRYLDRTANPVAETLSSMLDYLESHPKVPRTEQWKGLLALRSLPEGEGEAAVARDLLWLLHQGHVMDYARRGLEAVRKPQARDRVEHKEISKQKKSSRLPPPGQAGGKPLKTDHLRSPYELTGGLAHFGRMLDKIRLHAAGKLPADYVPFLGFADPTAFDGRICRFLHVDYAEVVERAKQGGSDQEILEWACARGRRPSEEEIEIMTAFLCKRGWRDQASGELARRAAEAGAPPGQLATFFDYIDFDEGRPVRFSADPPLSTESVKGTINLPDLRSPYEMVGGIVHFGRMLDKIRLHQEGRLPESWVGGLGLAKGFDGLCCRFLGIEHAELQAEMQTEKDDGKLLAWAFARGRQPNEEEILIWNAYMMKRSWRDAYAERLKLRLEEAGMPANAALTMFDFIDLDEGRPPHQSALPP